MTTFENAPPPADWVPPVGKHCGSMCFDLACPTCGDWVTPANIELGGRGD